MPIQYKEGDATRPETSKWFPTTIIAHVCNNKRAWGAGFSGALSKAYPIAEQVYRSAGYRKMTMGKIQTILVAIYVPPIFTQTFSASF